MRVHRKPTESMRRLFELAQTQGGYFTAKQAKALGYSGSKQHYHVAVGNWLREHRGLYRLALFPEPERPDLVLWWLWSRNRSDTPQGVYSHRTALSLYDLTDVMPSTIDMTVPPSFRRNSDIPKVLRLHYAGLGKQDTQTVQGVPVTKPLRTILDLLSSGEVPKGLLRDAIREAVQLGLITRSELRQTKTDPELRKPFAELVRGIAA